jgi:hypothetical protein
MFLRVSLVLKWKFRGRMILPIRGGTMRPRKAVLKKRVRVLAAGLALLGLLATAACDYSVQLIQDRDQWMRHSPWPDPSDPLSPFDSLAM